MTDQLPSCRPDIYERGTHVCMLAGVPSEVIEVYIKAAAKATAQSVDWHYVGGRANVLTLGDVDRVSEWIRTHPLIIHFTAMERP